MIKVASDCISLRLIFFLEKIPNPLHFPDLLPSPPSKKLPVSPQKKVTSLIIASVAITSLVSMSLVTAARHGTVINPRSG